jgi:hypothetical protein
MLKRDGDVIKVLLLNIIWGMESCFCKQIGVHGIK